MVAAVPTNDVFTEYVWTEAMGPKPDFRRGMGGPPVPPPAPTLTSTSSEAMFIFCERTVKAGMMDTYKSTFAAFAKDAFAKTPGLRIINSFEMKDATDKVLQLFYYDSVASFFSQPRDLSGPVDATLGGTKATNKCMVYGGWTEEFKEMSMKAPDITMIIEPAAAGFLKADTAVEDDGTGPIILISKRFAAPGKRDAYISAFQGACDRWFDLPGLISGYGFLDPGDETAVQDLRVMANIPDGFYAHMGGEIVQFIFANWVPTWGKLTMLPDNAGMEVIYEDAFLFGAPGDQATMVAAVPTNSVFTEYVWTEAIGEQPDFRK
jgi:hypothetical protein